MRMTRNIARAWSPNNQAIELEEICSQHDNDSSTDRGYFTNDASTMSANHIPQTFDGKICAKPIVNGLHITTPQIRSKSCPNFSQSDGSDSDKNFPFGFYDMNRSSSGAKTDGNTHLCFWNEKSQTVLTEKIRDDNSNIIPHHHNGDTTQNVNIDNWRQKTNCNAFEMNNHLPSLSDQIPHSFIPGILPFVAELNATHQIISSPVSPFQTVIQSSARAPQAEINPLGVLSNGLPLIKDNCSTMADTNSCNNVNVKASCLNDNSTPKLFSTKSPFSEEFLLNAKIGDESVRYPFLPGHNSDGIYNPQTSHEIDYNNPNYWRFQDGKSLELYVDVSVEEYDNSSVTNNHFLENGHRGTIDDCNDRWDVLMDEQMDHEINSRCNGEMCDGSTDDEFTYFDSSMEEASDSLMAARRPSNPVAQVLEFGDHDNLIPICQDAHPGPHQDG